MGKSLAAVLIVAFTLSALLQAFDWHAETHISGSLQSSQCAEGSQGRQVQRSVIVWYGSGNYSDVVAHQGEITHCSPYGWYWISGYNVSGNVSSNAGATAHVNSLPNQTFIPIIQDFNETNVIANLGDSYRRQALADHIYERIMYDNVDGINIDFEWTATDPVQQTQLTQFMTYLYGRLHPQGKHLSIDVVAKTSDTTTGWSGGFNYSALANCTDMIMVMTYDYHWTTSAPGPIAPTGWMDRVMQYTLSRVPASKVAMGIPTYGRNWWQEAGVWKSCSVWYHSRQALIADYNPTIHWEATHDTYSSNEPYFTYSSAGVTHTVYFQNSESIASKLSVAANRSVPSVAFWQLYDEDQAIWPEVAEWKAPNQAPIANAGADQTVSANVSVQFNGSASSDPDGDTLTYYWTFGDGGTSTSCNPVHTYTSPGTYTATLTVNDSALSDSDSCVITVNPAYVNHPPVANAGPDKTTMVNQALQFSGAGSSDPDGDELTYRWNFGDGGTATQCNVTHTYAYEGTYTATLNVSDGELYDEDQAIVVVSAQPPENEPPNACAGLGFSVLSLVPVTFNASCSYDPDGTIVSYHWDFGDGNNTTETGPYTTHTYSSPRTYTVRLTITDNSGATGTETISVQVLNRQPTASLSFTPSNPLDGTVVTFDASQSKDDDGYIASYNYDFGDGNTTGWVNDRAATHAYVSAGQYTAKVRVRDNTGNISETSVSVSVIDNAGITGYISSSADTAMTNSMISFTATINGTLPEGALYNWNFGDGEEFFTSSQVANHSYAEASVYSMALTVYVDGEVVLFVQKDIEITNRPPQITTEVVGIDALVKTSISLNVSAWDLDGTIVLYEWDFEGEGAYEWNSPSSGNVTFGYDGVGIYNCTVRVTDNDGGVATATVVVTVIDGYAPTIKVTLQPNSTVSGTMRIEGIASSSGIRSIQKVEFKLDSGNWQAATGTDRWLVIVNTRALNNGKHAVQVRAFDGIDYSSAERMDVYVLNDSHGTSGVDDTGLFYARLLVVILLGVLCLSIGGFAGRATRKRRASRPIERKEGEYVPREYGDTIVSYKPAAEAHPAFEPREVPNAGYEPIGHEDAGMGLSEAAPVMSLSPRITPIAEPMHSEEKVHSYARESVPSKDYEKGVITVTKAHAPATPTYASAIPLEIAKKKEYGLEETSPAYELSKEAVENKLNAVGKLIDGALSHNISMPEAVAAFEEANALFKKGDLNASAAKAERALETAELLEELYWDAFEALKEAHSAAEALRDPSVCEKLLSLADGMMANNMYVEAKQYAQKATKLANKSAARQAAKKSASAEKEKKK